MRLLDLGGLAACNNHLTRASTCAHVAHLNNKHHHHNHHGFSSLRTCKGKAINLQLPASDCLRKTIVLSAEKSRLDTGASMPVCSMFFKKAQPSGRDRRDLDTDLLLSGLRLLLLSHVEKNPLLTALWRSRSWIAKTMMVIMRDNDDHITHGSNDDPIIAYLRSKTPENRRNPLSRLMRSDPYLLWTLCVAGVWGIWKILWMTGIYSGPLRPPPLSVSVLVDCLIWLGLVWSSVVLMLWILRTVMQCLRKVMEAPGLKKLRLIERNNVIMRVGCEQQVPEMMARNVALLVPLALSLVFASHIAAIAVSVP